MQQPLPIPPSLSSDQTALIEASFARALHRKAVLAERVYVHLFALEPEARALFPDDLAVQRAKIVRALATIVRSLASDAELARLAEGLARSHLRFDLGEQQLRHMCMSILAAFEDCLGQGFTAEARAAWQAALDRFVPMVVSAQNRLQAVG